jgi:DNA-binding transcriptional ArsR family regulator
MATRRAPVEHSPEDRCDVRIVHLDRVDRARKRAIAEEDVEQVSSILKTLGDPTRLRIVMALQHGDMCVCDLAAALNLSESATSHQLRRLRERALVKPRRDGQVIYYALDDEHVAQLLELALTHAQE